MVSKFEFTVYLDDSLDSDKLITLMEREGWKVISPRTIGTSGWQDSEHLEFCAQRGYPLLTADPDDFRDLHLQWQLQGQKHAGILAICAEKDVRRNMSDCDIVRAITRTYWLQIFPLPINLSSSTNGGEATKCGIGLPTVWL